MDVNKKTLTSEQQNRISKNFDKFLYFASWVNWYPDLFLDMNAPEEGGIKLHFDQRVFLRSATRFFSMYGCFTRGWGKTLLEVLAQWIVAIRFPNIELSLTAQTKENAARLLKDKYNEIIRLYPFFLNEIQKTIFSKNDAIIIFKNGSSIDALANAQSSKGLRRKRLSIEESALIDNVTFEDAIKPIVEAGRITCGKLALINPEELNQQIHFFTTPSFRGSDEFQRSLDMVKNMSDLNGEIVLGSDWMLPCWYGRGSSKSAILRKKRNMSPITFDMNYGGKWTGTDSGALVSVNKLMNCRTMLDPIFKPESENDEFYIGVDVARSEKKTNNQSSVAVGKVIRDNGGRIIDVKLANIVHISNTDNFDKQAYKIKRIKKQYDARMVVVDGNGLGVGLVDALMKETQDPKTGEIYPAWNTVNTDAQPNDKYSVDCLFDLKAQTDQTKIISTFINMVDGEMLHFLEPVKSGGYEVLTDDDVDSKIMPFVQQELFFQEVCNLKLRQSGARLMINRVAHSIDKDRFSAVAYLLYYIQKYENVYKEIKKMDKESFSEKLKRMNKRPTMY